MIGECLERATTIDGRRRFYAPGQHPATYRDRYMVKTLLRLWRIPHPGDETLPESIAYHQRRVDEFDQATCLEKAIYIEQMTPEPDVDTLALVARLRNEAGAPAPW